MYPYLKSEPVWVPLWIQRLSTHICFICCVGKLHLQMLLITYDYTTNNSPYNQAFINYITCHKHIYFHPVIELLSSIRTRK